MNTISLDDPAAMTVMTTAVAASVVQDGGQFLVAVLELEPADQHVAIGGAQALNRGLVARDLRHVIQGWLDQDEP